MAKVAIIGDMHFGVKGGNPVFLEFQLAWLENCLQQLQAMGITVIIQTGDMFDVRAHIKLNILNAILLRFPALLKKYGIKRWITYGGNHDMFYRDSNEICSLEILNFLGDDELQFTVVADHTQYEIIGKKMFAFVPWLNKNNQTRLMSGIRNPIDPADYVFGHFEMVGMPMIPGVICEHGVDPKEFKKYKHVISGHFHTISQHTNCTMVGTPYHITWGDVQDGNNRGFWILDTETDELTLTKNEDHMTLFAVIEYHKDATYYQEQFDVYENNIVKVLVKDKGDNPKHYKKFVEFLVKAKFMDYKIIDTTMVEIEKVEISEEVLSLDTLSAMNAFIDGQSDDMEKDAVKQLAQEVYREALGVK